MVDDKPHTVAAFMSKLIKQVVNHTTVLLFGGVLFQHRGLELGLCGVCRPARSDGNGVAGLVVWAAPCRGYELECYMRSKDCSAEHKAAAVAGAFRQKTACNAAIGAAVPNLIQIN